MIPQLSSQSFDIGSIFGTQQSYLSPGFQRPYSWRADNAQRLLADIQAASAAADGFYFLGVLVLIGTHGAVGNAEVAGDGAGSEGSSASFEIVDGQQRLVTLIILLAVLRDLLARLPDPPKALLEQLTRAVRRDATSPLRVRLRSSDERMLELATGQIGATLIEPQEQANTPAQRYLVEVRDALAENLAELDGDELHRLADFVLTRCGVVTVVTSTIDRAYQMFTVLNDTGRKLSRGDILKAELIGQIPAVDRAEAIRGWDELEQRLGSAFEDLFGHIRSEAGRGGDQIVSAIRKQVAGTPDGAAGFISRTLAPSGRVLDLILRQAHEGSRHSTEINRLLRHLNTLSSRDWVPPLMGYWLRHGSDAASLLAFLVALDRFAYCVRIQGLGTEKRMQRLAALTALIRNGNAANGPWPQLDLGRDDLRAINYSLRDLHKRSPQVCKLVLLRLNEQLGGTPIPHGVPMTIEHILPTKIGTVLQWRQDFPDADRRQRLATCIGNLTLVAQQVNERAANHDYATKLAVYFGPDAEPITQLTAELRGISGWTQSAIEARHARLIAAMNTLWNVNIDHIV